MPSVPQHRSSSLEIWGRGEAKSFLLESRAGSIISRWQARARNLACLLKLTQSHSFQKLERPPTKSAWGSSTSLRIWRQLPSSSDHHPISLSPPIQILSWKVGGRKNELQNITKKNWNFEGKKVSTFENVATIFDRICQNLSQACSQYINLLSTQTSAKEVNIWHEKSNQHCICLNVFSFPFFQSQWLWLRSWRWMEGQI